MAYSKFRADQVSGSRSTRVSFSGTPYQDSCRAALRCFRCNGIEVRGSGQPCRFVCSSSGPHAAHLRHRHALHRPHPIRAGARPALIATTDIASAARLDDQVERRLGGLAHRCRSPADRSTSSSCRGPAWAPRTCVPFSEMAWAQHMRRRGGVVEPADRIDVVLDPIAREGLDQHERAVLGHGRCRRAAPHRPAGPCRAGSRRSRSGRSRAWDSRRPSRPRSVTRSATPASLRHPAGRRRSIPHGRRSPRSGSSGRPWPSARSNGRGRSRHRRPWRPFRACRSRRRAPAAIP